MYVLLTGRLVFRGNNLNQILLKNRNCDFDYPEKYWNVISFEAKDLVSKLLTKDPKERWNPSEALNHPWFTKFSEKDDLDNSKIIFELEHNYEPNKAEESNLRSATPIMGGRKVANLAPESPFLTKKHVPEQSVTPILNNVKQLNQIDFE